MPFRVSLEDNHYYRGPTSGARLPQQSTTKADWPGHDEDHGRRDRDNIEKYLTIVFKEAFEKLFDVRRLLLYVLLLICYLMIYHIYTSRKPVWSLQDSFSTCLKSVYWSAKLVSM